MSHDWPIGLVPERLGLRGPRRRGSAGASPAKAADTAPPQQALQPEPQAQAAPEAIASPLEDAPTAADIVERRDCEERSDEAIQSFQPIKSGLLRFARNDGASPDRETETNTDLEPDGALPSHGETAGEEEESLATAPTRAVPSPASLPRRPIEPTLAGRGLERALWRHGCDWLELHRLCLRARCRRSGRCCGNPMACLQAGVRLAPEPVRAFVRQMMESQELELSFEEAFDPESPEYAAYAGWIAGLSAARRGG